MLNRSQVNDGAEELSSRDMNVTVLGFCREDHFPPFNPFWVENNFTVWEWQVEVINQIARAMLTIFEQSQTTPEIASQVMTQAVGAVNGLLRVGLFSFPSL